MKNYIINEIRDCKTLKELIPVMEVMKFEFIDSYVITNYDICFEFVSTLKEDNITVYIVSDGHHWTVTVDDGEF